MKEGILYTILVVSLGAYGIGCWVRRELPELSKALRLVFAAAAVTGAIRASGFVLTYRDPARGVTLMQADQELGIAMLAGSLALGWYAIEQMVLLIANQPKTTTKRASDSRKPLDQVGDEDGQTRHIDDE